MGTYTTEGGFINTNLVTADEESQEFDDLIFALKTGEDPTCTFILFIWCSTLKFILYHYLSDKLVLKKYKKSS